MSAGPLDPTGLVQRLHLAGVDHVVIGGFAVIAHGVVRVTKDLDVCPDSARENLERLAGCLRALGAEQLDTGDFTSEELPFDPTDAGDLAEGGNFRLRTDLGILDVMQWIPGIDADPAYPVLVADAVAADVAGVAVRIAALAHLRDMKRAAGRPQDLQDLADLAIAHPEDR